MASGVVKAYVVNARCGTRQTVFVEQRGESAVGPSVDELVCTLSARQHACQQPCDTPGRQTIILSICASPKPPVIRSPAPRKKGSFQQHLTARLCSLLRRNSTAERGWHPLHSRGWVFQCWVSSFRRAAPATCRTCDVRLLHHPAHPRHRQTRLPRRSHHREAVGAVGCTSVASRSLGVGVSVSHLIHRAAPPLPWRSAGSPAPPSNQVRQPAPSSSCRLACRRRAALHLGWRSA